MTRNASVWPLLVQIKICRLFDAKPFPEGNLEYSQLDPHKEIAVNQNKDIFIDENVF